MEDPKENDYARFSAAETLLAVAGFAEKDRLHRWFLPRLQEAAAGDNGLRHGDAARIMRALRHPDCLPSLAAIVVRSKPLRLETTMQATMAIRELGAAARGQTLGRVLEGIGAASATNEEAEHRQLAFLWLADRQALESAEEKMPLSRRGAWKSLAPLAGIADDADEGARLTQVLAAGGALSMHGREWAILRLGDLKDRRAVKVLAEVMVRFGEAQVAQEALKRIAGAEVEEQMRPLLRHKESGARRAAAEVILDVLGERGCDLARQMLREEGLGEPMAAMDVLRKHGTPEDLPLLLPRCDYWKADRSYIYWATHAIIGIRERYNWDVNGPLVRQGSR